MSYASRALAVASALLMGTSTAALAETISGTDFETGDTSGWNTGTQMGTLDSTITGQGTGVTLSHRFGGKKQDLFGVSVEGSYATDNSVEVSASVDYKEMVFIEGVHQIVDGASNTAVAAKFKFKF